MGFVSRNDVSATTPGFFLNYRGSYLPFKKLVRSFAPGIASEFYHQASTKNLIERNIILYPLSINLQNGGYFRFSSSTAYQFLMEDFVPLGVAIGRGEYRYLRNALAAGSDPSRKVSFAATFENGGYYDGNLTSINASINLVPLPQLQ